MKNIIVDKNLVEHIAKLSHLYLDDSELVEYQKNLSSIIGYFNQLFDVEDISQDNSKVDLLSNNYVKEREDIVITSNILEKAIKQAPQISGTAFQVPKFVDK